MKTTGKVTGIVSNLVTVEADGPVSQNEICYITVGGTKLMAEVIKVNGKNAAVQVFEPRKSLPRANTPVRVTTLQSKWNSRTVSTLNSSKRSWSVCAPCFERKCRVLVTTKRVGYT